MSERLYQKGGVAHFACPVMAAVYAEHDNRTWGEWSEGERAAHVARRDLHGHSEWSFYWRQGDHHIEHPANGGVPRCQLCNAPLAHFAGSDPGHKR